MEQLLPSEAFIVSTAKGFPRRPPSGSPATAPHPMEGGEPMKLCVSAGGTGPDATVAPSFCRAPYLQFFETDTTTRETLENPAASDEKALAAANRA